MRTLTIATAVLALMLIPVSANASERYHGGGGHYSGHSYYGGHYGHYDGGHYGHYDHGHSNFSFGLSFGLFGGPRYYDYDYYPAYTYYRPYYPPPVYYDAPVYYSAPAPVYIAPRHYYYRGDCDYYYRPSASISFGYRYHYR